MFVTTLYCSLINYEAIFECLVSHAVTFPGIKSTVIFVRCYVYVSRFNSQSDVRKPSGTVKINNIIGLMSVV